MNLRKYEKIDIVDQMLETALSLFNEGEDYFSVLQIAGACEEILGKYLESKGRNTSLQSDAELFVAIKRILSRSETTVKKAIIFLNKPKNSIKHLSDNNDTTVIMDPREDAKAVINRAISNWWNLNRELTPLMKEFKKSQEQKVTGMPAV